MDLDLRNETFIDSECVRVLRDLMQSGAVNGSLDASNVSCGNASTLLIPQRVRKGEDHTLRILLYSLIFFLSVFGNLLIIMVITINNKMHTITNTFLLSLAMSDLMMAIFCMPFNLIPSILKDFIFGSLMCKIVAYLMGTSVSISTFNLVAIAFERYSAICKPLKSRAWQTHSHAYRVIIATWVLAFIIMIPYPIISHLRPFKRPDNTTAHQCRHKWPVQMAEQTWSVLLLLVLFVIPGVVMIVAYGMISRELYRGIQFETNLKKDSTDGKNGVNPDDGDSFVVGGAKPGHSMKMSHMSASAQSRTDRLCRNKSGNKLEDNKRVIRMLVVIVVMFFLCWMPLYCANTWRAFDNVGAERTLSGTPISFIQLLSNTSSCVNPIIYCFMNKRFRKALRKTLCHCFARCRHVEPRDIEEDAMATGTMARFSYTIVSTMGTS